MHPHISEKVSTCGMFADTRGLLYCTSKESFYQLCEKVRPFISKTRTPEMQCNAIVFRSLHQFHISLFAVTGPRACNVAAGMRQRLCRPCCIKCCKQAAPVAFLLRLFVLGCRSSSQIGLVVLHVAPCVARYVSLV